MSLSGYYRGSRARRRLLSSRVLMPPLKVYRFVRGKVRGAKAALRWDYNYARLREPKRESPEVKSWIQQGPIIHEAIRQDLQQNGFNVLNLKIDLNEYREYLNKAGYRKFPNYCDGGKAENFAEKSLEHFLAAKLIGLSRDDVYVDIANDNSPVPEIYRKLYGCKAYRQDLTFPAGVHGDVIGGDAGQMPVEDGFFTKMALHCSFEHFEQDSDIRFIKEAGRVLRKNGSLCIVPLYLFNEYAVLTDPGFLPKGGIPFENDAVLYCTKNWGNRHGRFYDVPHLIARIRDNLNGLKLTVYFIQNQKEVASFCYAKFALLLEKE